MNCTFYNTMTSSLSKAILFIYLLFHWVLSSSSQGLSVGPCSQAPSEHPAHIFQSAFCKEISNHRVLYSLLCSTSGEMKPKITLEEILRKEVAVRIRSLLNSGSVVDVHSRTPPSVRLFQSNAAEAEEWWNPEEKIALWGQINKWCHSCHKASIRSFLPVQLLKLHEVKTNYCWITRSTSLTGQAFIDNQPPADLDFSRSLLHSPQCSCSI